MPRGYPVLLFLAVLLATASGVAAEPAKPVTFTVDGATTQPISPFIYGTNMPDWKTHKNLTLCRWGGNRIPSACRTRYHALAPLSDLFPSG